MVNRKIGLGLIALSLGFAAAGCGGNGGRHLEPPPAGNVNFDSSAAISDTSTETTAVPPAGGTMVTTSSNGSVLVPSGSTTLVNAGDPLAIIQAGTGFMGVFEPGSQMTVNGVDNSGADVGTDGRLDQNVGLPVTEDGVNYILEYPMGNLDTRTLTVHRWRFEGRFYLMRNPLRIISPLPIALTGKIPNNGENAAGSFVTAGFGPGNNGRQATLFIDYGTGFTLQKTVTIADNKAVFTNLKLDQQNVPADGVQLISLHISDL